MTSLTDKARHLLGRIVAAGRNHNAGAAKVTRSSGPRWAEPQAVAPDITASVPKQNGPDERGQKPFVTPFYFWGTLAILMAGLAIGTIYWQLQLGQGDNPDEGAPEYADPLVKLEPTARNVLLNPTPELAARLKRSFLGQPDELCAELNSLGLENPGWAKAPFQKERWQCASDLVAITTPSVDFGATTLFFLLRGPSENKIDYLRLKLVVEDVRHKKLGLEAVWLVVDALAGRYGWTVPSEFRNAIAGFEKLETTHRGVRLSVSPEDPKLTGDPLADQRLNIILDFGEPDLIRPADSFRQAPPLENGWSVRDQDDPGAE